MQTETHSPPAKTKRPEGREFMSINFDIREFRKQHPAITRGDISEKLGLSTQSLDNYDERCPLSVYKAIVEAFVPNEAHKYELRLLVSQNKRPYYITDETAKLAREYDRRNAGTTITLADGSGFYKIPEERAEADAVPLLHDREVPLVATEELTDGKVVGVIKAVNEISPETSILLQQQEVLIAIIARVAKDRDDAAIQLQQAKQTLADRDATITVLGGQIKSLKESVREWEELSKAEPLKGTPITANATLLADEIIARLKGTFNEKGHPKLAEELDRISPKKLGYASLPAHHGQNGTSRRSR